VTILYFPHLGLCLLSLWVGSGVYGLCFRFTVLVCLRCKWVVLCYTWMFGFAPLDFGSHSDNLIVAIFKSFALYRSPLPVNAVIWSLTLAADQFDCNFDRGYADSSYFNSSHSNSSHSDSSHSNSSYCDISYSDSSPSKCSHSDSSHSESNYVKTLW